MGLVESSLGVMGRLTPKHDPKVDKLGIIKIKNFCSAVEDKNTSY